MPPEKETPAEPTQDAPNKVRREYFEDKADAMIFEDGTTGAGTAAPTAPPEEQP